MGTCFCQTGRYKEHFVCFACRKMFKKTAFSELPAIRRASTFEEYRPPCPECGEPMHNMGKEFKPPKHGGLAAWRAVEAGHHDIQRQSMTSPQSFTRKSRA